jgi:transcriptional regulator with XRE-family HTH domain
MKAQGLTQEGLAEKLGTLQPSIARLLSGKSGAIPKLWQEVLDQLDLELVAVPKGTDVSKLLGEKGR